MTMMSGRMRMVASLGLGWYRRYTSAESRRRYEFLNSHCVSKRRRNQLDKILFGSSYLE